MEWLLWIGGGATALGAVMKWIVTPTVRLVRSLVHVADAMPTLQGIADEFKPNSGTSLRDTVDRIERNQVDFDERFDTLESKIDTFVLQRQKGGRRNGDPQ